MPVIFDMKIFENQSMKRKKKKKKEKQEKPALSPRISGQICYNLANNSSFNPFSLLEL